MAVQCGRYVHGVADGIADLQVIADSIAGLVFKNKRDRKTLNVDPNGDLGDSSTRTDLDTHEYQQVVIYDHVTRRRA